MELDFKDQVVVVTGAARGVGAATVRLFASSGAKVIALDVSEGVTRAAAEAGAVGFVHDVTSPEHWARLERYVREHHGRLDSLVNNAAIEGACRFEDVGLEDWNRVMTVNVTGVFLGCQWAVRTMRRNPGRTPSTIVNIASLAARLSVANDAAYTASKGAVVSLTRSIAHYCARESLPIRCNSLSPGAIRTEMLEQFIASAPDPAAAEAALNNLQPVGYLATPSNIADAIAYLASSRSGFITGTDLVIDGGAGTSARLG